MRTNPWPGVSVLGGSGINYSLEVFGNDKAILNAGSTNSRELYRFASVFLGHRSRT